MREEGPETDKLILTGARNDRYGAPELKRRYRIYLLAGLACSMLLHFGIIAVHWISQAMVPAETGKERHLIMTYAELGPPPSIRQSITSPVAIGGISSKQLTFGIPVPVPDIELKAEEQFPTQEELSAAGNVLGEGTGGINIPDSVRAELGGEHLEGITPDVLPLPLTITVPRYPTAALRRKISGTVWVRVLVDERGAVKSANVQKTEAEVLNKAAIEAARKCIFSPGTYRKRPIPAWVTIPIEFRLEED
jgi:TonB family protein